MEIKSTKRTTEITLTINEREHALLIYIFGCMREGDNDATTPIIRNIYDKLVSIIDKPYQLSKYLSNTPEIATSSGTIIIPSDLNINPNFTFKDIK